MVFPKLKTGPPLQISYFKSEVLAPLQISYKAIRKQEITIETEKTWNLSKLKNGQKRKFLQVGTENQYTPRFLEGKIPATRGYGTRVGLPLSYSWTQRTLLHQTHKCGY